MSGSLRTIGHRQGAAALLVLLPGAYARAEDFVAAGFWAAVERRGLALDLLAVDLEPGAMANAEVLPALIGEILLPARRQGYADLQLGGVSLGAWLALCLNADTPGMVDGLCLLAPYPGSRLTTRAIEQAGGLAQWQASGEQLADPEFRVWCWLQRAPADFPVFLGYGRDDRFADGQRAIAECLPPSAVHTVAGGHEWPVWLSLWEDYLDRRTMGGPAA